MLRKCFTSGYPWFCNILYVTTDDRYSHCVKSVRIRSYSGPHFSRISPHSGWIRRDTEYLSVVSPNVGKYWPEKAQYCAFFKQCGISRFCFYCLGSVLDSAMVWRVLPKIWKNTRVWENSYIVGLYKKLTFYHWTS